MSFLESPAPGPIPPAADRIRPALRPVPPAADSSSPAADPEPLAPGPVSPLAERTLLALHALRQRQLRTAFLHGRTRNWRDRRRIWPAVLVAAVIVALAVAGTSVVSAFRQQQHLDRGQPPPAAASSTSPTMHPVTVS